MNKCIVQCSLDPVSIGKAIREIHQYKLDLSQKAEQVRKIVAERLAATAQSGFNMAMTDVTLNGANRRANVKVKADPDGKGTMSLVITEGEDAIWCEFGTGVYFNGAAGSSPHPKGKEFGMVIGGYGKGHGKRNVWGFKDGDDIILTHGAPASMPMYNAFQWVCENLEDIVREVFQ